MRNKIILQNIKSHCELESQKNSVHTLSVKCIELNSAPVNKCK